MRITVIIIMIMMIFIAACNQKPTDSATNSSNQTNLATSQECKSGSSLLFEDEGLSSFTEDSTRGAGVVSFQLEINDRLDITNVDGSVFGGVVHNDDGTYYTLDMPQKTIARRLIPAQDFAAFDFRCRTN